MCLGTTCLIFSCGQPRSCPFTREASSQPTTSLVPPAPSFTSPGVFRRRQPSSQAQKGCVNTRPHLHPHRRRPHVLFPYAIQVYPRIRGSRTPPRPPPVYTAALAGFGAYVTIHRIPPFIAARCPAVPRQSGDPDALPDDAHGARGGAPTPRCGSATCARGGLAPARTGGVWLGPTRRTHPSIHPAPSPESRFIARSLYCSRKGCPAERLPIPLLRRSGVCLDRRSRTPNRAGPSVDPCRARGA
ncbi:hypothetical protein B0H14DRAFT_363704 [Mycena olivaceomarginata]|nr:hypothetical protein B0H14DRAFT_363704 [Mycena olivaceomarginata]